MYCNVSSCHVQYLTALPPTTVESSCTKNTPKVNLCQPVTGGLGCLYFHLPHTLPHMHGLLYFPPAAQAEVSSSIYATPLITDMFSDGRRDIIVSSFVHNLEVR